MQLIETYKLIFIIVSVTLVTNICLENRDIFKHTEHCIINNFTIVEHKKNLQYLPPFNWIFDNRNISKYSINFDACVEKKENNLLFPIITRKCGKIFLDKYGKDYSEYMWNKYEDALNFINENISLGSKYDIGFCV